MTVRTDRRHRQHRKTRRGFTLIEVVISVAILGFIAATSAAVLFEGVGAYHRTTVRKESTDAVRLTMERLIREIRQVAGSDDTNPVPQIVTAEASSLVFDRVTGSGTERIYARRVTGAPNEIQLALGSTDNYRPLLEGTGVGLTFTYYKADGSVLSSLPLSADDRALVRRVGVEVEMPVTSYFQSGQEKRVKLRSSCYLRNMIGEARD